MMKVTFVLLCQTSDFLSSVNAVLKSSVFSGESFNAVVDDRCDSYVGINLPISRRAYFPLNIPFLLRLEHIVRVEMETGVVLSICVALRTLYSIGSRKVFQ